MKHNKILETNLRRWTGVFFVLITVCSIPLASAQSRLVITPENAAPGAFSLYKFEFALPDSLPRSGAVSLSFPASMDVSGVKVAASSTIKGGLQVYVQNKDVLVTRRGEGDALRAGTKVDLFLSVIKNPPDTASNLKLSARVHQDAGRARTQLRLGVWPAAAKITEGTFSLQQPE